MADCVNLFQYAKSIRKAGEDWKECIKRASVEVKQKQIALCRPVGKGPRKQRTFKGKTKSECSGLAEGACVEPCGWVKESKPNKKTGKVAKAHCAVKKAGPKKAKSIAQAREMSFPEIEGQW